MCKKVLISFLDLLPRVRSHSGVVPPMERRDGRTAEENKTTALAAVPLIRIAVEKRTSSVQLETQTSRLRQSAVRNQVGSCSTCSDFYAAQHKVDAAN